MLSKIKGAMSRYFDYQQNDLEIEENLKIILYEDGRALKR